MPYWDVEKVSDSAGWCLGFGLEINKFCVNQHIRAFSVRSIASEPSEWLFITSQLHSLSFLLDTLHSVFCLWLHWLSLWFALRARAHSACICRLAEKKQTFGQDKSIDILWHLKEDIKNGSTVEASKTWEDPLPQVWGQWHKPVELGPDNSSRQNQWSRANLQLLTVRPWGKF